MKNKGLAYGIAIVSDVADYMGAAVPVAGDILDIVTPPLLYVVTGEPKLLLGFTELIPAVDVLPVYTGLVFAVDKGYI